MKLFMSNVVNLMVVDKSKRITSQINLSCTGERGLQIKLFKSSCKTRNSKATKLIRVKIKRFDLWSLEGGVYRI